MEIRDEKLYKAVISLPLEFEQYRNNANKRFDSLEKAIDDAKYIDMPNGDGNRMRVAKVLPEMKKDIDRIKSVIIDIPEIKHSTEFLRDFAKVHLTFKKYKIYYMLPVVAGYLFGKNITQTDYIRQLIESMIK